MVDARLRRLAARALFPLMTSLFALSALGCDGDAAPFSARPLTLAPKLGSSKGGDAVSILGEGFAPGTQVLFDGIPAQDTFVFSGIITVKTPPHPAGIVDVTLVDALGRTRRVPERFEYATVLSQEGGPRLVSAISLGNTHVRVNFNEPVSAGADRVESYSIVQTSVNPESGVLLVSRAEPSDDGLAVVLTTGSQNEVVYTLTASDIRDVTGEPLAPPEAFLKPNQVEFAGTPPADGGLLDTDEDGLADNVEQSGWTVTIQLSNGDVLQSTVTSDPSVADTDGDGLDDRAELLAGSNPRNGDTDGDSVGDLDELRLWHSGPTQQDSDRDGLSDAADLEFETSPILADTDGDGMNDRDELFLFNRSALIANLPRPQIVVGNYSLQTKVTSSFTDVTGTLQSFQSTIHTGVSQIEAKSINRSDTRSTESANKRSQQFGVEAGVDGWKFVGKISGSFGFEQSSARGFSSTVSTETATQSQQVYEKSVSEAFDRSDMQSVTRSIDSASVQALISVANQGEVPFTITNLEVSLLRQDRQNGGAFTPVASLRPADGQSLAFNLGPFDAERGPIILENTDIFPNVVDELIREPQGLVFKVANFDVLDAEGKNFAFSSATVSSRTAGLTIDFGDGDVEDYRIATHSAFGEDGLPTGVSMARALEIAGFELRPDDEALPDPAPARFDSSVTDSVGTLRQGKRQDGPERLVRVRGVQNDLRDVDKPDKRFWTVLTNDVSIDPDADFSTLELHAGDEFLLLYTRDIDRDGLHELEENLYGSSDEAADTDGDGLSDPEEIREGWLVDVGAGPPRRVFSSPSRVDSDLDGLSDLEERDHGTDPNRRDTDNDGLGDALELRDSLQLALGEASAPNPRILQLSPYSDAAILALAAGKAASRAQGDDEQLVGVGEPVQAGQAVVGPGPNGRIDTDVAGDNEALAAPPKVVAGPSDDAALEAGFSRCQTAVDASTTDLQRIAPGTVVPEGTICIAAGPPEFRIETAVSLASTDFVRVGHRARFTLDPTRADTDLDGIPDGRETRIGLNPDSNDAARFTDVDQDGLSDALEDAGWQVCLTSVGPPSCKTVRSSKVLPDSDFDGLPDVVEFAIRSDPTRSDSDGDELSDLQELDLENPVFPSFDAELNVVGTHRYYDQARLDEAKRRCSLAASCALASVVSAHTNPTSVDSDGDGLSDYQEHHEPFNIYIDGKLLLVTSDPNLRDTDYDRLSDEAEFALKTDPTRADSDGDSVDDRTESRSQPPLLRSPIVKDRVITFDYTRISWRNTDCDATSWEDWGWTLEFLKPGAAQPEPNPDWSTADGVEVTFDTEVSGTQSIAGTPVTFVAPFGQTMTLRGIIREYGGGHSVDSSNDFTDYVPVAELNLGANPHESTMASCKGGTIVVASIITVE